MRKYVVIIAVLFSSALYPFSDQTTVERIMNENKAFIEFIDVSVSNFGEAEKEPFFNIYQAHFNAEVAFLQAEYKRSFRKFYESQKNDVKLYEQVLTDYYLEESKDILDRMAPFVIKSKNSLARLYLSLGYRDRALSGAIKKSADASHPRLYSYKINQYIEAIKLTRRAMRYAFLAIFEGQDVESKKYIFSHMFETERESGNPFYERFLKKQDSEIVTEINRDFDSYDKEYSAALPGKRSQFEAAGKITEQQEKFLGELRIERRSRFKDEKRVAEYIRNGEFFKAEDIIRKYVDDFNFKIINATFEVLLSDPAREKPDLDINRMKVHHLDNNGRYARESVLETFYKKAKIVDDLKKKEEKIPTAENAASGAATDASPKEVLPAENKGVTPQ